MPDVITHSDQLTSERLTAILNESDTLHRGHVTELTVIQQPHTEPFFAELTFFRVRYSDDAVEDLPAQILLKIPQHRLDADVISWGNHEVQFYNDVLSLKTHLPVPRCFHAIADPHTGASHLILEDMSPTHRDGGWPQPPPTLDQWKQIVKSLAAVHTTWWGTDSTPESLFSSPDKSEFAHLVKRIEGHFPEFVDVAGAGLVPEQRRTIGKLLASDVFDRRERRLAATHNIAFRHGDDHLGNYLLPHDPAGTVLLIDWHLWQFGIPTDDLVDMLPLRYFRRYCNTVEVDVLRAYHHHILEQGVKTYSWDDLWLDYRLSIAFALLNTTLSFTPDAHLGHQWQWLEQIYGAYEDLHIADLLDL